MGWFPDVDLPPDYPEYERLLRYAAYPNVYFLLSDFYGFGRGYPYDEVIHFVKRALERFGPQQIMWGSGFPRVTSQETCEMTLALPRS